MQQRCGRGHCRQCLSVSDWQNDLAIIVDGATHISAINVYFLKDIFLEHP